MAVHDLLAGVADGLLREAASYDLEAPLPSAPPLLSRDTHGGCDWFTGISSIPDRVTGLATRTDRTASCGQSRRTKHSRAPVPGRWRRHRGRRCQRPEAPITAAVRVLRFHGPTPLGTRPR